ncbi:MAG: tRNA (guanosine(37)-N1)-methyltransferase TrmD [Pseudomonadales bacterium]|nr:tRNA (guanosine(37)-N1)-methyltransferase TrmD [Pseudomonadales bacterium]
MKFTVVTLFPEMFAALSDYGISSRAIAKGYADLALINPRDFTRDVHRTVDDRPYGGGPGMVMLPDPVIAAVNAAKSASPAHSSPRVIYMSPQGKTFDQATAEHAVAEGTPLIFLAGRYEGIDERIIESVVDEEWSLGDYVLSGGELAAMVMMDTMIRLIPGVLGHQDSAEQDSFSDGLLDCPHYTRPEDYHGRKVPPVLLSGNHQKIREWRLKQSLGRTWLRRPELVATKLADNELTKQEQALLEEFKREFDSHTDSANE